MNPLKVIAKAILPQKLRHAIRYCLSEDYRDRCQWERDREIGEQIHALTGGVVIAGPFKGLKYVSSARGSSIGAKLLGTYEMELRQVVEQIIARGYRTIINIGAGEGYYAVGLAAKIPQAHVICFDADEQNQHQIHALATLNNVQDRLDIRGWCDDKTLAQALADRSDVLVVCDIEGGEVEVLQPAAVPALAQADVLVELHDIIRAGCSDAVRNAFQATHEIHRMESRPRTQDDFPPQVPMERRQRLECMDERRGPDPMGFFWMKVKR